MSNVYFEEILYWFFISLDDNNLYTCPFIRRLPTMLETQVQSLNLEDLLEKEMATHSSIVAWKISWILEPGRVQFMGLQRVGHD